MWVKICGNTTVEDALHAAEAGANALGFVFAPSPRRVSVAQVRNIVPQLPATIETYGIFVEATADEIVRTVLDCGLTGVQLHRPALGQETSDFDPDLPLRLRRHFAALHAGPIKIISVLSGVELLETDSLETELEDAAADADAVVVDSRTASAAGGTGIRFDWNAASAPFQQAKGRLRVIVAGGLNPENVESAIQMLNPWGVDVVSGVEAEPGRKDPERVTAFIESAKQAGKRYAHAMQ